MINSLHRESVLEKVRQNQANLERMGVKSLQLFGSVARDEAKVQSDVDFLAEFSKPVGFFELFSIRYFLEDLLGCTVDLGTADSLKEHLRAPVLKDAIRVF